MSTTTLALCLGSLALLICAACNHAWGARDYHVIYNYRTSNGGNGTTHSEYRTKASAGISNDITLIEREIVANESVNGHKVTEAVVINIIRK